MSLESEREKYMNLYESAVSERDALDRMLDEKTIPEKLRYTISKRLGILDSIIISNISDRASDVKRADEELNRLLADRESFIKDTRMILEEKSRYFFSQLQEKGLTDKEIDVCCMYAIGMKGKDIKNYAHIHNLYKDSSEMRRKLGLQENDTNLSLYIQKLLESGSR